MHRLFACLLALAGGATGALADENLDGFWMDSDGEVVIEIGRCGENRCGKVIWLKQPNGPDGLPLRDYRNSDPKLQSRFVCGLQVVTGFQKQSDGSWDGGSVYVSDMGSSYSGRADVLSPTQVKVTGYVGIPFFGESEVWTKVAKPPQRCSNKPPAAAAADSAQDWSTKVAPAGAKPAAQNKPNAAKAPVP